MDGAGLKDLRRRLRLTRAQLAEEVGVATNTVARWERDETTIPDMAERLLTLLGELAPHASIDISDHPIRDPLRRRILERLEGHLDDQALEAVTCALLGPAFPGIAPVRGGGDAGLDGVAPDPADTARQIPVIITKARRPRDRMSNLTRNLTATITAYGAPAAAVFATPRRVLPKEREKLLGAAKKLGVGLHVFELDWYAANLQRSPELRAELLQITGEVPAMTAVAPSGRPRGTDMLIGRDDVLKWLHGSTGDRLLVGEPGMGKTSVLESMTTRGWGLFLAARDEVRIADAIREHDPPIVIVDDAHRDPGQLLRLRDIRSTLGVQFDIVATCWPEDDRRRVEAALRPEEIHELEPLSATEIVEVIKAEGIHGPDALVVEMVRQVRGRPGLASTLCLACRKRGIGSIITGEELMLELARVVTDSSDHELLATFGLGGARGMAREFVQALPGYNDLIDRLSNLEAAGVIETRDDHVVVVPAVLRARLVRDVFFERETGNPRRRRLERLEAAVPDQAELLATLCGAAELGARVPGLSERVQEIDRPAVWQAFAQVSSGVAITLLRERSDLDVSLVVLALDEMPEDTVRLFVEHRSVDQHKLIWDAVDDWLDRPLSRTPRRLDRRRSVLKALEHLAAEQPVDEVLAGWLRRAGDPNLHWRSSIDGRTVTIYTSLLAPEECEDLAGWVRRVVASAPAIDDEVWSEVLALAHAWVHPRGHNVPLDATKSLRASGEGVLQALAFAGADRPGVQKRLRELADGLFPIETAGHLAFDTVFPQESFKRSMGVTAEQEQALQKLAEASALLNPSLFAERVASWDREARIAGVRWPRLIENLAKIVAGRVEDLNAWTTALVAVEIAPDVLFHFLECMLTQDRGAWTDWVIRLADTDNYCPLAATLAITADEPDEKVLDAVLPRLGEVTHVVEIPCIQRRVPLSTLHRLLQHDNAAVALEAATGEWCSSHKGQVREEVRDAWRDAVLRAHDPGGQHGEHWLAEMLKTAPDLAAEWLTEYLADDEASMSVGAWGVAETVVSELSRTQRIEVASMLAGGWETEQVLRALVDDDVEVYRAVLNMDHPLDWRLAPLKRAPDAGWGRLAACAVDAEIDADKIARAAFLGSHAWSGEESHLWAEIEKAFREIGADEGLRVIGALGEQNARGLKEHALEQEKRQRSSRDGGVPTSRWHDEHT